MKSLHAVVVAMLLLAGFGCAAKPASVPAAALAPAPVPSPAPASDPRDVSSAPIDGEPVPVTYFGNEAKGDLDGDGKEDVAFLVTADRGGSGTFFYAMVRLGKDPSVTTNALLLGDRIAPQTTEVRGGTLIVNYAERKPGEPMTARPSVGVSRYFKIEDGALVEAAP